MTTRAVDGAPGATDAPAASITIVRSQDRVAAFAAGAALMLASVANFLLHNDYPLLRLDVAIVAAAIICIAALLAPFYASQRQWGRSFLEGLLVAIFADLNGLSFWQAIGVGVVIALLGWWLKKPLVKPLAIFGTVVLLTTLAGAGARAEWLRTETSKLPATPVASAPNYAIMHLILDEQIGPEGVYPDAKGLRLRDDLRRFFLDRDFALYGRAYSEHMHTVNALPAVLNYGERLARQPALTGVTVGQTTYFTVLHRRGFRVHVLQNDFAELCADNPVTTCITYDSSSLRPTLTAPLSTSERAALIGVKFIALSKLAGTVLEKVNKTGASAGLFGPHRPPFEPGNISRTSTVAAFAATEDLTKRLRRARPGDAFFAHLLLPHYPHVVRSDCSYLPWSEWELRRSFTPIERRRRTYVDQDRCTLKKLDEMIRAFEASTGGRRGVVIIHGDHGSRIMEVAPVTNSAGRFTDADVIAAHSTLFAVRGRQSRGKYFEMPQPISALLRGFVSASFENAPEPQSSNRRGYVISDSKWRPQRQAPLPRGW